ncbi:MAG: sigma-70 family RNA polymerase sigma factor [Pirellulales bacterium]|nr:sigma-70 family RNA polymerase sigma factor [Pirellulales bacterium]
MGGGTLGESSSTRNPSSTSSSLIRLAKALEPEAWRRLVELYGPLIYHWCRASGLPEEDAVDVGQEVFKTVAVKIITFRRDRPGDSFRGWLRTITRNKIGDYLRRRKAQPQAAGGSEALRKLQNHCEISLMEEDDGEPDEENLVVQQALQRVQCEFEERTYQAFWRVTVEEQTPAAVAEDLGMTLQAVYKAKSRVLNRLRRELDGELC